VEVKDGEVTLSGMMNKIEEKLTAELITRNVLGVKDVHNEIEIVPTHSTAGPVGKTEIAQGRTRENIEEQQQS
jgi:BON domain-containing protein